MYNIETPYRLFLGYNDNPLQIKTSRGIAQWRPELCIGECGAPLTLGLEKLSVTEVAARGTKTFVLELSDTFGVPCLDPMVHGSGAFVDTVT